jgi:hypothetical protein
MTDNRSSVRIVERQEELPSIGDGEGRVCDRVGKGNLAGAAWARQCGPSPPALRLRMEASTN